MKSFYNSLGMAATLLLGTANYGYAQSQGIAAPPQMLYYVPGTWQQLQTYTNNIEFSTNMAISGTGISGNSRLSTGTSGIAVTGTMGNTGGMLGVGTHLAVAQTADASANSGGLGVIVANGKYWTGAKGGQTGINGTVTVDFAQTLSDTASQEFVALRGSAGAYSSTNGQNHTLAGSTIVAGLLHANATGWKNLWGQEIALQAVTGSTVSVYVGQYIMQYSTSTVRGSTVNSAFAFWNQTAQGATTGWKEGINFGAAGQAGLFFPFGQDATLIKATAGATDGALTVASIVDVSAIGTVTGNYWNSTNFQVTGAGALNAISYKVNGTAGSDCTSGTVVAATVVVVKGIVTHC